MNKKFLKKLSKKAQDGKGLQLAHLMGFSSPFFDQSSASLMCFGWMMVEKCVEILELKRGARRR